MESYSPELFQTDETEALWDDDAFVVVERRKVLEILARARIEVVPDGFSASLLMAHIRNWRHEIREWEIGPEPPAIEREVLEILSKTAQRLRKITNEVITLLDKPGCRIAGSVFVDRWDRSRLARLACDLEDLRTVASSQDVVESMRRTDRPAKQSGGWSAHEAFFGHDLPELYRTLFGREPTRSGSKHVFPSEGVRFECAVATEVLGYIVTPLNIVRQTSAYRHAGGGKRG